MAQEKSKKSPIRLDSLSNLVVKSQFKLPFPKRSIPVQVGVRSPSYIRFELSFLFYYHYSVLLKLTPIFRGKLGETLLSFTRLYFRKTTSNLVFIIPFLSKNSISNTNLMNISGGEFNHGTSS